MASVDDFLSPRFDLTELFDEIPQNDNRLPMDSTEVLVANLRSSDSLFNWIESKSRVVDSLSVSSMLGSEEWATGVDDCLLDGDTGKTPAEPIGRSYFPRFSCQISTKQLSRGERECISHKAIIVTQLETRQRRIRIQK